METESNSKGRLLGVLLIGTFMAQADVTIVNVATPAIHAGLGASGAALQLVVGGYLIAVAMLLITGARLGQAYGYRRVFLAGVSVFTLASLACGLAPDPLALVVARVLQGAGAGVMFPQTFTGIQLHFTGADRIRAIGRYALVLSGGAVSGQILGGVLVSANVAGLGWRAVFLVNVPVGVLAVVSALRILPADEARPARLDLKGVVLLSASVLLLVLPLTLGRSAGWPVWAWVCLAASGPAIAGFTKLETRVAAPLLNMHLLTVPVVRCGLVTMAVATSTYYALMFVLAQYLQGALGFSPLESGLMFVPWVAAFGVAGQLVRRLASTRWLPAAGCGLLAVAFAGTSAALLAGVGAGAGAGAGASSGHTAAVLAPLLGLGGLGLGIQFATVAGRMAAAVEPRYAPDISGVSSTLVQVGGSIGVSAVGALYLSQAHHPVHAFATATVTLAALALVALLAAVIATRPRTRSRGTQTIPGPASRAQARTQPQAQTQTQFQEARR